MGLAPMSSFAKGAVVKVDKLFMPEWISLADGSIMRRQDLAPSGSCTAVTKIRKVLFKQDTFLKVAPESSSVLSDSQKCKMHKDVEVTVNSVTSSFDGTHFGIFLDGKISECPGIFFGYIFNDHVTFL